MIITSKQNPIIKLAKQLQTKKFVELFGKCFLETEKIIKSVDAKLITTILVCESAADKYKQLLAQFNAAEIVVIGSGVVKFLSQTQSGSDIFAICELEKNNFNTRVNCLVLDNIQDPNNVGALVRSALAFGFENIIAINSAFAYTHKVIRASMGYIFKVNYITMPMDEFIKHKKNNGLTLLAAHLQGEDINSFNHTSGPIALVVGNEGSGINAELLEYCDYKVCIKTNQVESLNAATSGAIIMHKLMKGE